jgi:hypothetical protein
MALIQAAEDAAEAAANRCMRSARCVCGCASRRHISKILLTIRGDARAAVAREARRKLGSGMLEDEERKRQEIEAAATAARAASAAAVTTQIVEAEERRQRAAAETERLRAEIELMRALSAQEESERKRLEDERVRQEEQERREREAERLRQAEEERRRLVEEECQRLEAREREEMQEARKRAAAAEAETERLRMELEKLRELSEEQTAARKRLEAMDRELREERERIQQHSTQATMPDNVCRDVTEADQAADYRKTLAIPPVSLSFPPASLSSRSGEEASAPALGAATRPIPPPRASLVLQDGEREMQDAKPADLAARMASGNIDDGVRVLITTDHTPRSFTHFVADAGPESRDKQSGGGGGDDDDEISPQALALAQTTAASPCRLSPRRNNPNASCSTPPPEIPAPSVEVIRSVARDAYSQRSSPSPPPAVSPRAGSRPIGDAAAAGGRRGAMIEMVLDFRYEAVAGGSDSLRLKQAIEQDVAHALEASSPKKIRMAELGRAIRDGKHSQSAVRVVIELDAGASASLTPLAAAGELERQASHQASRLRRGRCTRNLISLQQLSTSDLALGPSPVSTPPPQTASPEVRSPAQPLREKSATAAATAMEGAPSIQLLSPSPLPPPLPPVPRSTPVAHRELPPEDQASTPSKLQGTSPRILYRGAGSSSSAIGNTVAGAGAGAGAASGLLPEADSPALRSERNTAAAPGASPSPRPAGGLGLVIRQDR